MVHAFLYWMKAAALSLGVTDELAYWISGTTVQAFAALTALTGVFGVFKLQQAHALQNQLNERFCRLTDGISDMGMRKYRELLAAHLPQSIREIDLREGIERWTFDTDFKPWLQELRRQGPDIESREWATSMLMQAHMLLVMLKVMSGEYDRCLRAALIPVIANGVAVIAGLVALTTLGWVGGIPRTGIILALVLYGVACVVTTLVCTYIILKKPGAVGRRVISVPDPFENLHVE